MKKLLTVLLVALMVLTLSGCKKEEEDKKILSIMLGGGTPQYMDPALNSASTGSNIIKLSHAGLMGYQYDEKGNPVISPELASKYEVSADGMTYVFTLREGLKWSDGSEFKASELVEAWKRAASEDLGADYGFLFMVFEGYDDGNINVVADDAKGTITCKLAYAAPYFLDLCAFPVFFPIKVANADAEGVWATKVATNIGMGAFVMTEYTVDDKIVYEKNPYYWNAEAVELDGVVAYLSEDNAAILTAYENDTVQFINSIDPTEFSRIKSTYGDEFQIADQMGTWYVLFNVHKDLSPVGKQLSVQDQSKVRYALGLMVDRETLVNDITQGGQVAATGFFPNGLSDGLNSDVRAASIYGSWYTGTHTPSDVNSKYTVDQVEACNILIDLGFSYTGSIAGGDIKFTDVPSVEFAFNNSGANKAIIEYIQGIWDIFGIKATVNQEVWATLQTKLGKGDAEAARMGWVADYNDVTNFIEIFISASGNNYPRLGQSIGDYTRNSAVTADAGLGAYWGLEGNQTWAEAFDALDKAILYETDPAKRAEMSAQAEKVIMASGAVAPMYFYTNPYMLDSSVSNVMVLVSGDIIFTYAKIK